MNDISDRDIDRQICAVRLQDIKVLRWLGARTVPDVSESVQTGTQIHGVSPVPFAAR